jgi:hypothetical protein
MRKIQWMRDEVFLIFDEILDDWVMGRKDDLTEEEFIVATTRHQFSKTYTQPEESTGKIVQYESVISDTLSDGFLSINSGNIVNATTVTSRVITVGGNDGCSINRHRTRGNIITNLDDINTKKIQGVNVNFFGLSEGDVLQYVDGKLQPVNLKKLVQEYCN